MIGFPDEQISLHQDSILGTPLLKCGGLGIGLWCRLWFGLLLGLLELIHGFVKVLVVQESQSLVALVEL